jgi:hypothetical protein
MAKNNRTWAERLICRHGYLFPRGDDGAELAAAEQALLV